MIEDKPDPRNFLRDILWITVPCSECVSQPGRGLLGVPFLKFGIYDVLSGQGIAICPECRVQMQLAGEHNEVADRLLLAQLDSAWREICGLFFDRGLAQLTTPPEDYQ